MKRLAKVIAILSIAAFCASAAVAADGNPKKGKYLFKKSCKSCHVEGAEGGVVTPMKKTQAQWERFFGDKSSACATKAGISEQDMKDVQQYLIDHAADSDQPETCG